MQHDNIIDSITEAQAKGFIEWLLLKYGYQLVLADAHDLASRDTDKIKMVMTYKIIDDDNYYPNAPIIIRDGDDFIGYVLWTCYNTNYAYRDILKQMFSGHDIYLYWDIKPIISKNVSFSTLFVEYDLQDLCRQKV